MNMSRFNYKFIALFFVLSFFVVAEIHSDVSFLGEKFDSRFPIFNNVIKQHKLEKQICRPFIFFSQKNLWILTVRNNDEYVCFQGLCNSKKMLVSKDSLNHKPIKDLFMIVSDSVIMNSATLSMQNITCGEPVIDRFTIIKDTNLFIWNYGYKNRFQDEINKRILRYLYDVFNPNVIYLETKKYVFK